MDFAEHIDALVALTKDVKRDEHGRFGGGGGGSSHGGASGKSKAAFQASTHANRTAGDKNANDFNHSAAHTAAATAHEHAANAHSAAGNMAVAMEHRAIAQQHRGRVDSGSANPVKHPKIAKAHANQYSHGGGGHAAGGNGHISAPTVGAPTRAGQATHADASVAAAHSARAEYEAHAAAATSQKYYGGNAEAAKQHQTAAAAAHGAESSKLLAQHHADKKKQSKAAGGGDGGTDMSTEKQATAKAKVTKSEFMAWSLVQIAKAGEEPKEAAIARLQHLSKLTTLAKASWEDDKAGDSPIEVSFETAYTADGLPGKAMDLTTKSEQEQEEESGTPEADPKPGSINAFEKRLAETLAKLTGEAAEPIAKAAAAGEFVWPSDMSVDEDEAKAKAEAVTKAETPKVSPDSWGNDPWSNINAK